MKHGIHPTDLEPGRNARFSGVLAGILAAAAFVYLGAIRLGAQGLYYDEVHQVPAAFRFVGRPIPLFTFDFASIPLFNMPYSGALKSWVYGVYLALNGGHFSVTSWRLLGLLAVAFSLPVFSWAAARRLGPVFVVLFSVLFLTDSTVVLAVRHDWGPVAFALAFRLLLLSSLLELLLGGRVPGRRRFWLVATGLLLGLSVFEKLSNLLLVPPVLLLLALVRPAVARREWLWIAVASLLGAAPVWLANTFHPGFSLEGTDIWSRGHPAFSASALRDTGFLLVNVLGLGAGVETRGFICGTLSPPRAGEMTAFLLLVALLGVVILTFRRRAAVERHGHVAAAALLAYAIILLEIATFPAHTWVHHWIMATPFQYVALAAGAVHAARVWPRARLAGRSLRAAALLALLALIVFDGAGRLGVQRDLAAGRASVAFDPSLTRLGEFAAAAGDDAIFVSPQWGLYAQIIVLGDGRLTGVPWLVHASDIHTLHELLTRFHPPRVYVVWLRSHAAGPDLQRVLAEVPTLPGYRQVAVEDELRDLRAVDVRKLERQRW